MQRNIVIAAVTAAALAVGGTATALAASGDDDDAAPSAKVTASEAIAAALKDTPGTAVSAELDDDEGGAAWEVDVLAPDDTWHSVRVDPAGGKVRGSYADDEDDAVEVRAALKHTTLTATEAVEAASAKGQVTSVDLDDAAWEAETHTKGEPEHEWLVDAQSGRLTADED
ncbi:PepSY domain-containing protein [Streptomyces sp. NPDC003717]|uniref:PepSY domain-containing protein n=1 Tax=Streptomyces sp. NPDC003717 TaxID=3154276 RepID=UPI0033A568CF